MNNHILVVDDDPQITSFLDRYLVKQGYRVTTVGSGKAMIEALDRNPVDLIILDIGLPDRDGFELTQEIRARSDVPIIVLSARDETYDRVIGLEIGADDYVTKPFEPRELSARIKSVLRRYRGGEQAEAPATETGDIRFGPWLLKAKERDVFRDETGEKAGLTTAEFDILSALARRPGIVFDRNQLLDIARGRSAFVNDRSIDVHIMRLRRKLEADPSNPVFIKTVHGAGYVFAT